MSNEIVKYDLEYMSKLADEQPEELVPATTLGTADNCFKIGEEELGPTIEVYVLEAGYKNVWYDKQYIPGKAVPPACYALGLAEKDKKPYMAPAANAPVKMSDNCATCAYNQFGSADNGKGKKCKNRRICSVIPVDTVMSNPDILTYEIPPTSLTAVVKYRNESQWEANSLGKITKIPHWSVKTEITLRAKKHFFKKMGLMPENERPIIHARIEEAKANCLKLIDCSDYEPTSETAMPQATSEGGIPRFARNHQAQETPM